MSSASVKLIQLSDLHLCEKGDKELLGVNTDQSFDAVLDLLKKDTNPPKLIILSGDLAQEPLKATYERLADQISELNIPSYFVPGNHDNPEVMASVFPRAQVSSQRTIVLDQWQIILLNSHKPNSVEGYISREQFDFLHEALEDYPEHYATIVLHHHPVPMGCTWIDDSRLINAEEFWEFLKGYPQVRLLLFGHVHHEHSGKKNGIQYYSAPSTCFQFQPTAKNFSLDLLPPGFRWLELYSDGKFSTGIQRLDRYIGVFDENPCEY